MNTPDFPTDVARAPSRRRAGEAAGGDSNSVQKVCAVLRALGAHAPQRLTELAASAGLNKVTALRILDTLVQEDFVQRTPDGKAYAPGRESLAFAASQRRPDDVRELGRASLVRLAELSGDTALLSVRSGIESVCVDRHVGSFPIRANYLTIGSRRPLGVGAGSMALLAFLPDREREAVLGVLGSRLGAYPHVSLDGIETQLALARSRGYVLLLDFVIDKMSAIGAPVFDAQGRPIAALSIAALTERIRDREEMLSQALLREADLMRRELVSGLAAPVAAGKNRKTTP